MDEADYLCDRVGIIDHGKILVIDSTTSLKNAVGNDVITLSCSDIEEFGKRLGDELWIKNIKQHDTFLTLGVKKGEEKIPVVFEIARNLNIKIKSISVRKPTLDDVFLHFTGRTMRDQEKKDANIENLPPRLRSRGR
jgi:ABC-2 type transport system ATP-binding protein